MPVGPGKYDELCTYVREQVEAEGAILIVLNGKRGTGFSVQGTVEVHLKLPSILREMANQIECDVGG
jgi:hypothetical protein